MLPFQSNISRAAIVFESDGRREKNTLLLQDRLLGEGLDSLAWNLDDDEEEHEDGEEEEEEEEDDDNFYQTGVRKGLFRVAHSPNNTPQGRKRKPLIYTSTFLLLHRSPFAAKTLPSLS